MLDIYNFRKEIEKTYDESIVPGFVIAAGKKGGDKILESFGYKAILPERKANSVDTVYDLASLTKVMATTTALMQFIGEGKINLEMKIGEFIDAYRYGEYSNITIKNLLSHTAGYPDWYPFFEEIKKREKTSGECLIGTYEGKKLVYSLAKEIHLTDSTLTSTKYSDIGFIILGEIVEFVSGEHLDTYCENRVFGPLGLSSIYFVDMEKKRNGLYANKNEELFAPTEKSMWRNCLITGEVHDDNAYAMGGVSGHAGLFGTANDVYKFGEAILDCYNGTNSFISQRIVRTFAKRQLIDRNSSWALGWDTPSKGFSTSGHYFSEESIGHTGYTGTSLWIDLKKEVIVVILSNRVHPERQNRAFVKLRPLLHDIVMETLGCTTPPGEETEGLKE